VVIKLRAVERGSSEEVVQALTELLDAAKAGHLHGFAYVAMLPAHGYEADVLGHARSNPIMALGMAAVLEHAIDKLLK
jgi:hypothetical protein